MHNMARLGDREVLCCKKAYKIWNVNIDNIVISKLVKAKTISKYLIVYLDKTIRLLVLIMNEWGHIFLNITIYNVSF